MVEIEEKYLDHIKEILLLLKNDHLEEAETCFENFQNTFLSNEEYLKEDNLLLLYFKIEDFFKINSITHLEELLNDYNEIIFKKRNV